MNLNCFLGPVALSQAFQAGCQTTQPLLFFRRASACESWRQHYNNGSTPNEICQTGASLLALLANRGLGHTFIYRRAHGV